MVDIEQVVAYRCNNCGATYVNPADADNCCRCVHTYDNGRCTEKVEQGSPRCSAHQKQWQQQWDQQRFDTAAEIEWVIDEDHPVQIGYDWYYDFEYLMDGNSEWAIDPQSAPQWAHPSKWEPLTVDLRQLVSDTCVSFTEGVEVDDVIGLPLPWELQQQLDQLSAAINAYMVKTHSGCWLTDYSKKFNLGQQVRDYAARYADEDEGDVEG